MRRRVSFWRTIRQSLSLTSFFGTSFDLDYPIECDDEYWETGDHRQDFKQPPGKPSAITGFVRLIKLLEILALAHRTLYSTKKSKTLSGLVGDGWEQRVVTQLDSSMNQWKDSLPDHRK